MASMEFWFEYGSTYSYLSVARIGRMAQRAGVEVAWRPFLLTPILSALGMPNHCTSALAHQRTVITIAGQQPGALLAGQLHHFDVTDCPV